jgi:hypothetical protein
VLSSSGAGVALGSAFGFDVSFFFFVFAFFSRSVGTRTRRWSTLPVWSGIKTSSELRFHLVEQPPHPNAKQAMVKMAIKR